MQRDIVEFDCKSCYGEERCKTKCSNGKCPGLEKGKCLSRNGQDQPAPPLSMTQVASSDPEKLENTGLPRSTVKGAYL